MSDQPWARALSASSQRHSWWVSVCKMVLRVRHLYSVLGENGHLIRRDWPEQAPSKTSPPALLLRVREPTTKQ